MTKGISLIRSVEAGSALSRPDAEELMEELLSGRVETPDIVRLLDALNQRHVTAAELSGFATIMRRHSAPVFLAHEHPA